MVDDYQRFLAEYGFTEEQARASTERTEDMRPMLFECAELRDSPIEGLGLFATRSIEPFHVIGPARLHGMRTPAGRYVNHARRANCVYVVGGSDLYLMAERHIPDGEELTVNYRQSLSVNGWGIEPDPVEVEKTRQMFAALAEA